MRITATAKDNSVRQVYRRVGGGFTTKRPLALKETVGPEHLDAARKWVKGKGWSFHKTESSYPFIVLDTDTRMVNKNLAQKINKLGKKMQRYVWMGEGLRTRARQQQLWNEYVARGYAPPLVARPGTSRHETGDAADISLFMNGRGRDYTNVGYVTKARKIMRGLGLALTVPGEAWHAEISNVWRA